MPDRQSLLNQLAAYQAFDDTEEEMRTRMHNFVAEHADCFSRELETGHITASCWVVNPDRSHALLAFHGKLDRWLQMGGHVEDDPTLLESAMRELEEESGLPEYAVLRESIFDLDIHPIPERPAKAGRPAEPAHFHYDVRFLVEADPTHPLTLSPESRELAWVELERVTDRNDEESMIRMVAKTRKL